MNRRRNRCSVVIGMVLVVVALAMSLAACSSGDESRDVIHVEEGAEETLQAQTAWVLEHPSPTPGPSPSPTATSTPYAIPTNSPDVDPATVITRVGSIDITLDAFQKQVRFERWYRLWQVARRAEELGVDEVLDLTLPVNQMTLSLFVTLADSNSFGVQVQRIMVIDAITMEEAIRRNLDVDLYQFDARLAEFLGLQVGTQGALPPEFDAVYADFLEQMAIFTGMTEEDFRRIVRARTLYSELEFLIGQEPEALEGDSSAGVGLRVQDILVDSEEEAAEVITRLEAGESMLVIGESFGLAPAGDEYSRVVRRADETMPVVVLDALFAASPGDIVGPIAITQGWYVARVVETVFDVLTPEDIDAARQQYFLDWVEGNMDDPGYVEDFDNWVDFIPQEPLPMDVSPLLHDEYIIVPEGSADPFGVEDVEPPLKPESTPAEAPAETPAEPDESE